MDLIYAAVTLVLMGLSYTVGLGRGRWGDKRRLMLTYTKCACGHGNNSHHGKGGGPCGWSGYSEKHKSNMVCTCLRFTPIDNGDNR